MHGYVLPGKKKSRFRLTGVVTLSLAAIWGDVVEDIVILIY